MVALRRRLGGVATVVGNVFELIVKDGLRGLLRNRRTLTPALGSMSVLLLLAGLGGLGGLAVHEVVVEESEQASLLHVYLKEGASGEEVGALEAKLRGDRRVVWVSYVSKQQALAQVRSRPGLGGLVEEAGENPLPASLQVQVRSLGEVGGVAQEVSWEPAVDPSYPSSYDAETYRGLQSFVRVVGLGVSGLLLVLGLVSALVTANAIRAGIVARWDDLTIMRLVGASGWMVRGPFVLEGGLLGGLAGCLGAGVLLVVYWAAERASEQSLTELLPGVGWGAALGCAGALLVLGALLGSLASLLGLRGLAA